MSAEPTYLGRTLGEWTAQYERGHCDEHAYLTARAELLPDLAVLDLRAKALAGDPEALYCLTGDPRDTDYADYARDEADAARYPDRDYGDEEQAWLDAEHDKDRYR